MYENIESETLSVENIYWQSATIGIFLKRFMWSNEWKGLLIKRLQKKMGTFCGKKPSSANE